MSYTYVPAFHDYGLRKGPVRAFVVHMAEGGGTVGFLSRQNLRGVSVHYVIEYSGRIVQMLHEDRASGSINPNALRTSDGPAPYGATVRKQVMGAWDRDPNSAVITVEIEGYAANGPNSAQDAALIALVRDVRGRYPAMGLLGHRDFTSTKACPGPHIIWSALGGHGPVTAPPVTYTASIRPFAVIRSYRLDGPVSGTNTLCIGRPWTDTRWLATPSSAPCKAPVNRKTCDGQSSATTVRILSGVYAGHHIRVGNGVSVKENT